MKNEIPVAGCAHQADTCWFGMDLVTSALNTDCRASTTSTSLTRAYSPSIGAVNPALTALANALRVGERVLMRLA
jgi:hypothetical protein